MRTLQTIGILACVCAWVSLAACEDKVVYVEASDSGGSTPPPPGSGIDSCKGHCGAPFENWDECACDEDCVDHGDCCKDYYEYCTDEPDPTAPPPGYSFPDPLELDELSYGDCRGWAGDNSSLCDTSDCKGIVNGSSSSCTTPDCKGIVSGDPSKCRSALCKGVAAEDVTLCESDDCKGLVEDYASHCDSSQCKAIVNSDPSRCP